MNSYIVSAYYFKAIPVLELNLCVGELNKYASRKHNIHPE